MAIVITKQPTSVAVYVNDTVSIALEAAGDGLTYDWQYSANGTKFYALSAGASASNWTYDQPTLTFKGYIGYLKYYFRCKITDSNGDSVFSNIVRAINLAEAGAGFILPETMHSLAEAIRAKTETTDKILPADMAAMIESIGGIPDGVTELEVAICAPTGLITLSVPCSMSAMPTCVVAYQKSINAANAAITACMYFNMRLAIMYSGGSTMDSAYNKCTFASGVFTLNADVTASPRFRNSDYVCVMWR